jgi:outer membrane protein TolC
MRRSSLAGPLAILAAVALVAAPVSAQEALTLEDCLQRALQNSPQLARADRQFEQSVIQRRQASSSLLPSVGLSGAFSRYTSVSPQRLLNPATNQIIEGSSTAFTSTSYFSGLNVNQALYDRSITARYTQAVALEHSAEANANLERQRLMLLVNQAYYGVLRARRNLEVAQADLSYNQELLRQVQTLRELGNRAQVDVLRQESALAQARQRLIAAENGVAKAVVELHYVMGEPVTGSLELVDDLEYQPVAISLDSALNDAMAAHPSLHQALLGLAAAQAGVEAARASRYPAVNLSGNYAWRGESYLDFGDAFSRDYTWSVGVSFYVPLFDGLRTRLDIQRARVDLRGAEEDRTATELLVSREVYRAVLDLRESEESLLTVRQAVTLAGEAVRLAEELYRIGSGTLLEVNASQFDQVSARYQEVQALFNLKVARASLDFAIGGLK